MRKSTLLLLSGCYLAFSSQTCRKSMPEQGRQTGGSIRVDRIITSGDQSRLLELERLDLPAQSGNFIYPVIEIDSAQQYQTVDGFGYTLTGGSAFVINHTLKTEARKKLLRELFGNEPHSIAISYLRISIGASDLDASVFSYDDLPAGQTDETLTRFTIEPDKKELIPLLQEILSINPSLKILGSPWSPPAWMKTNSSTKGGSLKPEYYMAYAQYLVKYIQAMQKEGIRIDAITPQNEPLNPDNNPSLFMTAAQQATFIKSALGPALQRAGLHTRIIVYDHNADHPEYPMEILADSTAARYVDGSAFHLYAGDISALSKVHEAFPSKNLYFTEQYTANTGQFAGDLNWHIRNVIIGSMRNWCRTALEWNLANDTTFGPHTPGGCTTCQGALTIGDTIRRNVAYYIIAHASKWVTPGSVRIRSSIPGSLQNAAFKTPQGKTVVIVLNEADTAASFGLKFRSGIYGTQIPANSVATYKW